MTDAPDKHARLIAAARDGSPAVTIVAHPCDETSLRGAVDAAAEGIIAPVLVGPAAKIVAVAAEHGIGIAGLEIIDAPHSHAAAAEAVALIRSGRGELLMKGSLHTDELMKEVMSSATGLRTERRISHVFVMDVAAHDRLLLITDAAVNINPDLEAKRHITQNAIAVAHALGIMLPHIAVLSAMETVNPAIPSSVHAAALRDMARDGRITGGVVDGPLAFDNTMSVAAARIKGITSPVSGIADILVMPGLEAGNILYKSLVYISKAIAAGVVMGARVPIILTSRADSAHSRIASAAVACLVAHAGGPSSHKGEPRK